MKKHLVLAATAVAVMAATSQLAFAEDTSAISTPDSPQGWYFSSDHTGEDGSVTPTTGTGGHVQDAVGGQPGPGSYLLDVTASQKARLETTQFNHLTLGDLASFGYATSKTGMTGYAPSINVMIDPAIGDDFATIVWEANKAGHTVVDGVWQTWNTSVGDGWWTPTIQPFNSATDGSNANPTDLETLTAHFGADSTILSVAVNVGRHGAMTAHVDDVSVVTSDATSSFDFELYVPTKDDCKNGGWATAFPAGQFKNQGDCVSSFGGKA